MEPALSMFAVMVTITAGLLGWTLYGFLAELLSNEPAE